MDILSHIPILCEETDNPYVFVTSKDALGAASSTKRPTSCVMICPTGTGAKKAAAKGAEEKGKEDYAEDYAALHAEIRVLVSGLFASACLEQSSPLRCRTRRS